MGTKIVKVVYIYNINILGCGCCSEPDSTLELYWDYQSMPTVFEQMNLGFPCKEDIMEFLRSTNWEYDDNCIWELDA